MDDDDGDDDDDGWWMMDDDDDDDDDGLDMMWWWWWMIMTIEIMIDDKSFIWWLYVQNTGIVAIMTMIMRRWDEIMMIDGWVSSSFVT